MQFTYVAVAFCTLATITSGAPVATPTPTVVRCPSVVRAVSTVSGDDRGTGGFAILTHIPYPPSHLRRLRYFDPHPLSSLTPPSALLVRAQEFQSAPAAKPAGVVYRAVQLGRGAAQGEWRVEFGAGNLTTVTHLAATPVSLPLSFVDAALFYPTPGEDHAILDVEAGADGSPPLGTFLLVPEDHEETWQRLGVRALRKRESEVSGGLGDGSGTNCCTCWCVGHRQGPWTRSCVRPRHQAISDSEAHRCRACVGARVPLRLSARPGPACLAPPMWRFALERACPTSRAWRACPASRASAAAAAARPTSVVRRPLSRCPAAPLAQKCSDWPGSLTNDRLCGTDFYDQDYCEYYC